MIEVDVREAKTHLSRLVQAVIEGQEVVICRGDEPLARLVAFRPVARLAALRPATGPRELGWAGAEGFWMAEDFDARLEDFSEYTK